MAIDLTIFWVEESSWPGWYAAAKHKSECPSLSVDLAG